jgi:hypothetical protein
MWPAYISAAITYQSDAGTKTPHGHGIGLDLNFAIVISVKANTYCQEKNNGG